jgi:hypothetical protein
VAGVYIMDRIPSTYPEMGLAYLCWLVCTLLSRETGLGMERSVLCALVHLRLCGQCPQRVGYVPDPLIRNTTSAREGSMSI